MKRSEKPWAIRRVVKNCSRCGEDWPATRDFFYGAERCINGLSSWCKECVKARQKAHYHNLSPERKRREYLRRRDAVLEKKYGLPKGEYEGILAEQGGGCAICGSISYGPQYDENHRLAVDHDHDTGHVRGLLCRRCNQAVGLFGENHETLAKAVSYLNAASTLYRQEVA